MSLRPSQDSLLPKGDRQEASNNCTPPKAHLIGTRLNFFTSDPEAMKAMLGLDRQIARSGLEKSMVEGAPGHIELHRIEATSLYRRCSSRPHEHA
jgi:hypothetical protein